MAMVVLNYDASPHALRIVCASSDTGTLALSQATLVSHCAQGPLRQFLQGLSASEFNALNDDMRLRISAAPRGTAAVIRARFTGGNLNLQASGASDSCVTLDLAHSAVR